MFMLKSLFDIKCLSTKVFVYPKLPAIYDFRFIRFRGAGLANCMFVASRAFLIAQNYGWNLINPTWGNIILGPYLRNEKDKRHYSGLFKNTGISGLSKLFCLLNLKKITLESAIAGKKGKVVIEGLGNYFEDLLYAQEKVKIFIYGILKREAISEVENIDFKNVIGVHIRLGDFQSERRTSINWYEAVVKEIIASHGSKYKFFVFSDGQDHELFKLLSIPQVERVFFGNALSDIIALSKCKLIIGSDSTFSAWGAFLEQVPIIFPRRHFGEVLINKEKELVYNGNFNHLRSFINDSNIL
jgi:hypothetical protein